MTDVLESLAARRRAHFMNSPVQAELHRRTNGQRIASILVVDDNAVQRLFYSRLLRNAGYDVSEAQSAETALRAARERRPDLVLLDVQLGDSSGFDVCRELKADPRLAGLMVMHISASHVDEQSRVLGLRSGADGYLVHPISNDELLARVAAMVRIRRSEEALLSTVNDLHHFMEAVPDMFFMLDTKGCLHRWNRRVEAMAGVPAVELLDRPMTEFIVRAEREEMQRCLEKALLIGYGELQCRIRFADGREVPHLISFAVMKDPEGLVIGLAGVGRDVTERLRLEEELRHAQKMEAVGRLAGGVAHDFNNLLTVIQGYVQMLAAREDITDDAQEQFRAVSDAAARAGALTRQLLTFSRKQVMQSRQLDLNNVVADLTKMLRRIIGETVQVNLTLAPSLPSVRADQGMLEQVVMNLAINARDAMPKGGDLVIATEAMHLTKVSRARHPKAREGHFVCLTVRDTGCGMSADIQKHLFEPFFTTKAPGAGTGLGLATAYGIVEQHEGWIEVESTPGQGSTFRVFLPCDSQPAAASAPSEPVAPTLGGAETILLIEDEPALRTLARMILERNGYHVLVADCGPVGMEVWAANRASIDMVLTDVVIPGGMSGWELAESCLSEKLGLKVLYTSGYSADAVGNNFLVPGQNLLPKPYRPNQLLTAVRRTLDNAAGEGFGSLS